MAKLVRIKDVHLYVALVSPETAADCAKAIQALKSSGVKHNILAYTDDSEAHKQTCEAISTWTLGDDGHKVQCSQFPILTWDECFDDWHINRRVAHGLADILASEVLSTGVADKK